MRRQLCALLVLAAAAACSGGGDPAMAIPSDAQTTASGISWTVLKAGTGTEHPAINSRVLVHYRGWTMDGNEFDSSHKTGKPLEFALNRFIPGWIEGLQMMVKGETRKLWIPAKLAYEGIAGRPQGMLVFEIELLDFR